MHLCDIGHVSEEFMYSCTVVVEFLRNDQVFMVKLLRADGGCLGTDRR